MDPTVELACETTDDDVFLELRAQRAAAVAALSVSSPREKAIARQKKNICDMTDKVEKLLRIFSRYEVDSEQTNQAKRFSTANKAARLKDLRLMWIELKR